MNPEYGRCMEDEFVSSIYGNAFKHWYFRYIYGRWKRKFIKQSFLLGKDSLGSKKTIQFAVEAVLRDGKECLLL